MKITELKEASSRRLRVLEAAHKKIVEAEKALDEAHKVYRDMGGHSTAVPQITKKVSTKLTLGKFSVAVSVFAHSSLKGNLEDTYDVSFLDREGHYLLPEEVMAEMTHSDLDAFKYLKKNIDDFMAGKIDWPYPCNVEG